MRLRATVCDALRHRVRLAPYDVLSQHPSVALQCQRQTPRYTKKLLSCSVAVAYVQPQHTIICQQLSHHPEYINHIGDILPWRFFKTKLPRMIVISKVEVWRRGDAHLHFHILRNQVAHRVSTVAEVTYIYSAAFHRATRKQRGGFRLGVLPCFWCCCTRRSSTKSFPPVGMPSVQVFVSWVSGSRRCRSRCRASRC